MNQANTSIFPTTGKLEILLILNPECKNLYTFSSRSQSVTKVGKSRGNLSMFKGKLKVM